MEYNIQNLHHYNPKDGTKYFIDANVWIFVLVPLLNKSNKHIKYRELFERIKENTKVRIVANSLILSEVVNRIIRDIHYNKFITKQKRINPEFEVTKDTYKLLFRPSEEFRRAYMLVCDDIKNFNKTLDLVDDGFGNELKFKHVLKDPEASLDFNDNCYSALCKKRGYTLITDDKDFWVKNLDIVTANQTLLDKHAAEFTKHIKK